MHSEEVVRGKNVVLGIVYRKKTGEFHLVLALKKCILEFVLMFVTIHLVNQNGDHSVPSF